MVDKKENVNLTPEQRTDSIVDKLLRNEIARKEKGKQILEKVEEWRDVVNRIGATRDGQYFLKVLVKHSGLFNQVDNDMNGVTLLKEKVLKEFYLNYIRPHLDKVIKNKIE